MFNRIYQLRATPQGPGRLARRPGLAPGLPEEELFCGARRRQFERGDQQQTSSSYFLPPTLRLSSTQGQKFDCKAVDIEGGWGLLKAYGCGCAHVQKSIVRRFFACTAIVARGGNSRCESLQQVVSQKPSTRGCTAMFRPDWSFLIGSHLPGPYKSRN